MVEHSPAYGLVHCWFTVILVQVQGSINVFLPPSLSQNVCEISFSFCLLYQLLNLTEKTEYLQIVFWISLLFNYLSLFIYCLIYQDFLYFKIHNMNFENKTEGKYISVFFLFFSVLWQTKVFSEKNTRQNLLGGFLYCLKLTFEFHFRGK